MPFNKDLRHFFQTGPSKRLTMKTDAEIIAEVLSGNKNAYAELVLRHQDTIRRYCLGIFGSGGGADDAAQEVFIKAYRGLSSFKEKSAFGTWLYRIAINHCRDLLRKKSRRKEASLNQMQEELGDAFNVHISQAPTQSSFAARELAEKMLALVSEPSRAILILREVEGLSYEEMTSVLNCSLDAVKSRLKRARQEIEEKTRHLFQDARV